MERDPGKNNKAPASLGWNDVLAFVLEMGALALWGLWAWSLSSQWLWKIMLAALAVGIFIAAWAMLFARTAKRRPASIWLFAGKLVLLLPPGLLHFSHSRVLAVVWSLLVLGHLTVSARGKTL